MKKLILILCLTVACTGIVLAQTPTLKIIDIPISTEQTRDGDGFLNVHWTQNAPFNSMCPIDPVTNSASYAGCPAVAMAQILHYLQTTNGTRFNDDDDYYHNYAGRQYNIDDDWETMDFPSFETLNAYLDELDSIYAAGSEIEAEHAAALVFACGTACHQVYTSQGSGTFQVGQAHEAFRRFGFENCVLFTEPTEEMHALLQDNLAHGYPALLAVESEDQQSGHNLVVDGYRAEDNKYHMNFGYGGQIDGWYSIPDPDFYYNLTRLEGIVLNIIPVQASVNEFIKNEIEVYPNPATDVIFIKNLKGNEEKYAIFNVAGQEVQSGTASEHISILNLTKGLYIIKIKNQSTKFIVE